MSIGIGSPDCLDASTRYLATTRALQPECGALPGCAILVAAELFPLLPTAFSALNNNGCRGVEILKRSSCGEQLG